MGHDALLPECEMKFTEIDRHIEDSPRIRDMVVKHETKIGIICADIDSVRNWIIASSAATILTIVLAALGLAVTWGRTIEKVERLDRIHQELAQK